MSTNLACFLFGIPATFFWLLGLKRGVMQGRTRLVRRNEDPFLFWIIAVFWGSIAVGLWVAPILSWVGLRE